MVCYQDVMIGGDLVIVHECPECFGSYAKHSLCKIDAHPLQRIEGDTLIVCTAVCPKEKADENRTV